MDESSLRSSPRRLPLKGSLKGPLVFSLLVALLMTLASMVGLIYKTTIYPTEALRTTFLSNDVVNLFIGLPVLLGSIWLAGRGSLLGLLFWPGALFYVVYNYVVYLFGMPFNATFMLYLALVTVSIYTMIVLMACIHLEVVKQQLAGKVPEKVAGLILAGLGILIGLRVIGVILNANLSHSTLTETELAPLVTDFLIAPAWLIGGLLLWQRKAIGYAAGVGLLFLSSMLFIGLIIFMLLQPILTEAPFSLVDILVVAMMGLVCFIPLALFLRGVRSAQGIEAT